MRVIRPGRAQRGVTLVELLVSLVMGLVLLAGVATVFLANKETFRVQEAVASGQENGRFALSVITRDLRSSGHWGCNSVRGTLPVDRVATPANSQFGSFDRAVFAYRVDSGGAWTPPRDVQFTSGSPPVPVNDSDVIVIRALRGVEVRVTGQTAATAPISFRGCTDLQTGHTALVSDCTASAVFNVTNVTASCNGTIVHGVDLGKQFPSAGQPAEVQRIENVAYFVATSANGRPALFRWNGVGAAEELVEGIERLRVRFGVDTSAPGDGAVDAYLDPSDASIDWDRVMNVRVTLVTTSSEQGITDGTQSYLLDVTGSSVFMGPSPDTRLRQVYSETVAVRNRQS